jgi:hypothetical protein
MLQFIVRFIGASCWRRNALTKYRTQKSASLVLMYTLYDCIALHGLAVHYFVANVTGTYFP